jgi:nitroreductase
MNVTDALRQRISVRAFLPEPLPQALVREILDIARWAPSGGNLQPWRVIAVAGAERQAVIDLARRVLATGADESAERPIYPAALWEPYRSRRFALGEQMYELLGIPRSDRPGRLQRFAANFEFFGAPVALFFVIDSRMGHGQWAHLGMFMQSVALAALERGVASCMQEAWGMVRQSLGVHFALGEHEMIYCGMALGRADPGAPVNRLRSQREPVEAFAELRGFGPAQA